MPWLRLLRLFRLFQKRANQMFPTNAFAIVLDFAKGGRPWSVEVFDAIADLAKWCYRAIAGESQPVVGDLPGIDSPIEALEALGQSGEYGAKSISPDLISFVLQYLMGILLEKLKK